VPEARKPEDFLADITVPHDGIEQVREAQDWSRDKLGILSMYLPAFATACHKRATEFYFVDGFAGEGLYSFPARGEFVLGSSLIALGAQPQFAKVLSMELSEARANSLRLRTAAFGRRSVVRQGDTNQDLLPAMADEIPPAAPTLVLLDPEGLELEWSTVQALAGFREGDRKVELLILVPTGSIGRVAEVAHDSQTEGANRIDFMFPYPSPWQDVWERRRAGQITPEESRDEFAEIYRQGLISLGYTHTEVRPITRRDSDSASVYHLVFASDHPAGRDIMVHTFGRMYANRTPKLAKSQPHPDQLRLF
jgi:three-Cys-motif partner protein